LFGFYKPGVGEGHRGEAPDGVNAWLLVGIKKEDGNKVEKRRWPARGRALFKVLSGWSAGCKDREERKLLELTEGKNIRKGQAENGGEGERGDRSKKNGER